MASTKAIATDTAPAEGETIRGDLLEHFELDASALVRLVHCLADGR